MSIIKKLLKARKVNLLAQIKAQTHLERLIRNNQGKRK